jgi:hypothetical protein
VGIFGTRLRGTAALTHRASTHRRPRLVGGREIAMTVIDQESLDPSGSSAVSFRM